MINSKTDPSTGSSTPSLVAHPDAGYCFLPGIAPYSSGVVARAGFEIVHVQLAAWMRWDEGLAAARRFVERSGLTCQALCAVELRCPRPHSLGGFVEFNDDYRSLLERWEMLVGGQNPVARTNVSPAHGAPAETVLHAFSFARPSERGGSTFVVAGGGELPHRDLKREHIVRVGETTADAMRDKARCVLQLMRQRMVALAGENARLSAVDVYTVHPLRDLLDVLVASELPTVNHIGCHWYLSRPPVEEIEFEMDMRGVWQEWIVDLQGP